MHAAGANATLRAPVCRVPREGRFLAGNPRPAAVHYLDGVAFMQPCAVGSAHVRRCMGAKHRDSSPTRIAQQAACGSLMRCASLTPGAPGVQAQSPGRRDAAASEAASAAEAAAIRAEAVEEGALEMGALEAYILAQRPPAAQARALAVRPPPPPPPLPPRLRPRLRPRAPVRPAAPRPALALLPVAPGGRLGARRGPRCPCGARAAGRPPVLLQTVCGCGRLSVRQRTGGDPAPAAGMPGPRWARVPGAAAAAPRRARVGRPGAPCGRLPRGRAAAATGGRRGRRAHRGRPPGRRPQRGGPAAAHAAADAAAVPGAGGARGRGRTEAGSLVLSLRCCDAALQHNTVPPHADWCAGQVQAPGRCWCSANARSLVSWAV